MQKIPMPDVLNADRVPGDEREEVTVDFHKARAENLQVALDKWCEYAQQLWRDLDAARAYLVASLPPESSTGDDVRCAAPRGPGDSDGWAKWADAYAAVTSVLADPHGDSGFGVARPYARFSCGARPYRATHL